MKLSGFFLDSLPDLALDTRLYKATIRDVPSAENLSMGGEEQLKKSTGVLYQPEGNISQLRYQDAFLVKRCS